MVVDDVDELEAKVKKLEAERDALRGEVEELQAELNDECKVPPPFVEGHEARWLHEQLTALRGGADMPWQLDAIDEVRDWLNTQRGAV